MRSLTVIDFHGARDHGPKLAPIARCWGGDHVGCLPVCPRSRNRAWAALLGRVGEGRRGRAVRGNGLEDRGGEGQGVPPHHRHKIQPGYRCVRVIRSAPKRLPLGDSRVYGQESCPQPENDHREDEKNSPYKPEGSFGERHKARRCRPSPISRTQGATRNRKSARRKMILRSSLGGTACSKWQTKMLQDFSGV